MLISYKWLQEYFEDELPNPNDLADLLNSKSFEVEEVQKVTTSIGEDYVLDIDILPNRSHDCLCHNGIAKEIQAILDHKMDSKKPLKPNSDFKTDFQLEVNSGNCRRYMGMEIKNLKIAESPIELKAKMESLGQKSINNLVDITNLVMFEIGQPMHAFDASKIENRKIIVDNSMMGEKIVTLDKKEINLDNETLLIKDAAGPLAIAGVKGGNKAEVTQSTTDIFLESANFDPTNIRIATKKVGIKNDSSKRFENEINPELAELAIYRAVELIFQYAATEKTLVSNILDHYPKKWRNYRTGVSVNEASKLLGTELSEKDIENVFNRLDFKYEIVKPREKIKEEVLALLDRPYKYGASVFLDAPTKFDCSSLVSYVYSLAGYSIPRMAVDQFVFSDRINKDELLEGDLIFANTGITDRKTDYESVEFLKGTKIPEGVDHVGIYIGDNKVVHATAYEDLGVIEENLEQSQRFSNIVGYGRIIKDEKRFAVTAPLERLDIKNGPDLIEEIGRIHGYEKIKDEDFNKKVGNDFIPKINRHQQLINLLKQELVGEGFSEIITYSFVEKGSLEPFKPIASDKCFLRESLTQGMEKALDKNVGNAELLGLEYVKIFEIGKVFKKIKKESSKAESDIIGEEKTKNNSFDWQYCKTTYPEADFKIEEDLKIVIGVRNKNGASKKQNKIILEAVAKLISERIQIDLIKEFDLKITDNQDYFEISIDQLIGKLFQQEKIESVLGSDYLVLPKIKEGILYNPISLYPFVLRDIAVWIPKDIAPDEILKIVRKYGGELLVNYYLFDTYEKEEKVSYAHRLVFQSNEKTLTDEIINQVMEQINKDLADLGWEVR